MDRADGAKLNVAWHLTAFLDLLGQRERLRQLHTFPANEYERMIVSDAIHVTAYPVMALRRLVNQFFNTYLEGDHTHGLTETLVPGAFSDPIPLSVAQFSDSIAVSLPVVASRDHFAPMRGVVGVLLGVSAAWCTALTEGWPLRGGVDLGLSTQLETGETYGASLERAVALEERSADWPRIVVGRDLVKYLDHVATMEGPEPRYRLAAAAARECKQMLFADPVSGCYQLDTLGGVVRLFLGSALPQGIAEKIKDYADKEAACHRSSGNEKLVARYERLRAYAVSREATWR